MKEHIRPILILFLPSLAILIYGHLNTVFLGLISGEVQLAFYNQAYRIVFLLLGFMTSLSTVMLPRMTGEFTSGNIESMKIHLRYVLQFVIFISVPLMLGLVVISDNFIIWFLTDRFQPVVLLIYIISAKILLVGLSNVFGLQVLVATGRQNKYTIAISIGALCSIVVNVLFAFEFGAIATALALLVAEIVAVGIQMVYAREFYQISLFLRDLLRYSIVGVIMFLAVITGTSFVNLSNIMLTIFQVAIGVITYLGILSIVKDPLIYKAVEIFRKK